MEYVARSVNDPSDLGDYVRESGTPQFSTGTITGGDTGVSIGGNYAAASFDNISVTGANAAGFEISGSTDSTFTDISASTNPYGILIGNGATGSVDFNNINVDSSTNAGVYYAKDIQGDLTGTITNSVGAALKFGPATSNDLSWNSMNLGSNGIGVENAGSGTLALPTVHSVTQWTSRSLVQELLTSSKEQ